VIQFLRDVGKHFPLGGMLAKESVRSRMGSGGEGISYTEFSYQILQAYDFLELFRRHGCTMQMGGSDQWGNITAGIRLIARTERARAFGVTFPLVTKSDGTKFGKTETDSIWLDPQRTAPYEMYQFWLNTADKDVVAYLKCFTFLRRSQVRQLAESTTTALEQREAQRHLAGEVTALVHGRAALRQAEEISAARFGGTVESLSAAELAQACRAMPSTSLSREELTRTCPSSISW
jgi:tyrosyl-tRNA synthetase